MNFIGQKQTIRRIEKLGRGTQAQGVHFPHSIFTAFSGSGKTELARQTAALLGVACHEIHAGRHCDEVFWAVEAGKWSAFDIVFIDEVHRLTPYAQEILYTIIDRHVVPGLLKEKGANPTRRRKTDGLVTVPEVSIFAATDQPGTLNNALRKRFQEEFVLRPYTVREMRLIIRQRASEAGVLLSPQAIGAMANASRGNPRVAGHLINSFKSTGDKTQVTGQFSSSHVRKFLRLKGVSEDGCTVRDLQYLRVLSKQYPEAVSLRLLTSSLNTDRCDVERTVEPWLIQCGYVTITRHGRRLTDKGRDYYRSISAPESAEVHQ